MTELRTDPILERQVLVAEHRRHRPNDFAKPRAGESTASCPFCPGHETATPPANYELPNGDGGWRVRVVPNKYPAVVNVADPDQAGTTPGASHSAWGAHEVIVESPQHVARTSQLARDELADVWRVYAERLRHWRDDGRFRYGLVIQNVGPEAGASLAHLHSQLFALPAVPPPVVREVERLANNTQSSGHCAHCQRIADDRRDGARVVIDQGDLVVCCPQASLHPFEMWLEPVRHEPSFEASPAVSDAGKLADVVHEMFRRLERAVPAAAYNTILRTAPWTDSAGCYHWRFEVRPRVAQLAGFEAATGIHINHVAPERAARLLREA